MIEGFLLIKARPHVEAAPRSQLRGLHLAYTVTEDVAGNRELAAASATLMALYCLPLFILADLALDVLVHDHGKYATYLVWDCHSHAHAGTCSCDFSLSLSPSLSSPESKRRLTTIAEFSSFLTQS